MRALLVLMSKKANMSRYEFLYLLNPKPSESRTAIIIPQKANKQQTTTNDDRQTTTDNEQTKAAVLAVLAAAVSQ